MDDLSAALQLTGELQRSGNVVSTLRGTTLVIDTSQADSWRDLVLSLKESDDFKDLRVSEEEGEFSYVGVRFRITLDGTVAYIEAIKK